MTSKTDFYEMVPGAGNSDSSSKRASSNSSSAKRTDSLPPYEYYDEKQQKQQQRRPYDDVVIKEYYEGSYKPEFQAAAQSKEWQKLVSEKKGDEDEDRKPISQNDARLLRIEHLAEVNVFSRKCTICSI